MKLSKETFVHRVLVCGLAVATVACGSKKDDSNDSSGDTSATSVNSGGEADSTIALTGKINIAGASLVDSLTGLQLYCITFAETPSAAKSDFGTDGSFSVILPKGVNFGCFVNDKATNATVASLVVESDSEGFGSGQSAMALSSSADLGALTIGSDGVVKVPKAVLAASEAPTSAGIVADDLDGVEYKMECQDVGDATVLATCKQNILDGNDSATVFFRVLKGTEGGNDIRGLGVWENKAAFTACGSVDMTTAEQADLLAKDGVTLTNVTSGAFSTSADCPRRNATGGDASGNIQHYFALSKLVPNGSGYSFRSEDDQQNGDCSDKDSTSIEFTGTNAVMYGAFASSEYKSACGTDAATSTVASFNVKFTKQ